MPVAMEMVSVHKNVTKEKPASLIADLVKTTNPIT